ncbi:MAG: dihydrofolate reductase family protein, partial [Candidatus Kapabacteria bacterium]|nr:dihydrofolate reductase family protein [Candidatus Kapabacteria bacterium]
EGGSDIFSSFTKENMIDELHIFTAPKIIGNGLHSFENIQIPSLDRAYVFEVKSVSLSGTDIHTVLVRK